MQKRTPGTNRGFACASPNNRSRWGDNLLPTAYLALARRWADVAQLQSGVAVEREKSRPPPAEPAGPKPWS
eukprot:7083379-Lingulodinium_polyedra.AAC.1